MTGSPMPYHRRFPATSANLGAAFDTAALALDVSLEISAEPADAFSIDASGRDADACGRLKGNLILDTYRELLMENRRPAQPLRLEVSNAIPLGRGCGSSAAARLAAVTLAVEFGALGWSDEEILLRATQLEGHPDNAAACWLGGMTVSAIEQTEGGAEAAPRLHVARMEAPSQWRPVLVFPSVPLRTEAARNVLPSSYVRADVIANLQRSSLLVAAFATGRGDLLREAMKDRLHQPYRTEICPLLREVEAITGLSSVLGAALSGAGPSMLLIVERDLSPDKLLSGLDDVLGVDTDFYMLACEFESRGAVATAPRELRRKKHRRSPELLSAPNVK